MNVKSLSHKHPIPKLQRYNFSFSPEQKAPLGFVIQYFQGFQMKEKIYFIFYMR